MDQKTDITALKRELEIARSQIEQYVRAANIEEALENVRASSLAMRHTSELQEVINTVGRQFRSLDINNTGGVFVIINEELDHDLHVWGFGDTATYSQKVHIKFIDRPIHTHLLHAIKNSRGFLTEAYSKEEKVEYFAHLFKHPPYNETSKEHQHQWLSRSGGYTRSGFISDHTTLFMINHHGVPFSKEENQILIRFAHVFEQSYIRFLDLQKAETQAREAQIEAALERVRSRSMAMQSSEELADVCQVMITEVRELSINSYSVSIGIFNEQKHIYEIWISVLSELTPKSFKIPYLEHPDFTDIHNAWKGGSSSFSQTLKKKELENHLQFLINNGMPAHELLAKSKVENITHCVDHLFFKYGAVDAISPIENLSEQNKLILKRFATVFEQTYTRFLDLQKAETQAREAQIEAALERVRAASMAMHSSDELFHVGLVFLQQIKHLGIPIFGVGIAIYNEQNGSVLQYMIDTTYDTLNPQLISFKYVLEDFMIAVEAVEKFSKGEKEITIKAGPEKIADWIRWVRINMDKRRATRLEKMALKQMFFHVLNFHGKSNINFTSLQDLSPADWTVMKRMVDTFGLSYTRFLDLQKAEAQAKEAQIEAALERIRSRSLAMHHSKELTEVSTLLFKELFSFCNEIQSSGIVLCDREQPEQWMCSYDLKMLPPIHIPKDLDPPIKNLYKAWESQQEFFVETLDKEASKKHSEKMMNLPEIKAIFDHLPPSEIKEPESQTNYSASFKQGYLLAITDAPADGLSILPRFANVFEQTYTRFLDLQKAEAQAREAQVQAALERVRAASMAMHNSDDLPQVASVLFSQIEDLQVPGSGCGVILLDDGPIGKMYYSIDGEILPEMFPLPVHDDKELNVMYQAWKQGDAFYVHHIYGEAMIKHHQHLEMMFKASGNKRFLDISSEYEKKGLKHDELFAHHAYFEHGCIILMNNYEIEEQHILRRLAKVFNQAYSRFLDLQRVEAQAREAQIEAALERIRARTMAMHDSDELTSTASLLFAELESLGIRPWAFGFNIWIDESSMTEAWSSSASSEIMWKMKVPHDVDPTLIAIYKNRDQENAIFNSKIEGEALQKHIEYMFKLIDKDTIADLDNSETNFPSEFNISAAYFKYGYLLIVNDTLVDGTNSIYSRVAKAFEQTYTRFLDLQKAESQAREFQIEAALEKVRSASMAMHNSAEFPQITLVLVNQLTSLNIQQLGSSILIIDEKTETYSQYAAHDDLKSKNKILKIIENKDLTTIHLGREILRMTKAGEKYFSILLKGKDLDDFIQDLIDFKVHKVRGEAMRKSGFECVYFYFAVYHGLSPIVITTSEPLPEADQGIFKRMATTFGMSYRRFLDLKKAENQAKLIREERDRLNGTLKELQTTQAQLIHSEKMASLGELTAGIAHEIQNPLNFVNNFSEIGIELIEEIEEELENNDPHTAKEILRELIQNLQKIHHHGERASGIVRGMLDHSRASSNEKTLTDINQLCDEYLRLAYHGLRAKDKSFQANFQFSSDPDLPKVLVASQDMGRVLLNLINNGFQATLEKSKKASSNYKPELVVTTIHLENSIQIQVKDNGSGIPREIQEKIFQPFFTTKPTGQGTGLGLSLAYDIIKAHGGTIKVQSIPENETKFIINLPLQ